MKDKKIKNLTIIYGGLSVIGIYLVVVGVLVYLLNVNNWLTQKTSAIIPYPAALVGTHVITIKDVNDRVAAVRRFYENQDFSGLGFRVDFSTPDGEKRLAIKEKDVLNKMIEDKVLEREANQRGIKLTPEMISQEVNRQMEQYGTENFTKDNLSRLYGWTITDFEENIVKPSLYKDKLLENLKETDPGYKSAKDKIEAAKNELASSRDFAGVARKYSDGESSKNGGDLGWFSYDQMLPEVALSIANLDKGQTSDIIESRLGYHIIRIDDKNTENGQNRVKISQIFVKGIDFSGWLTNEEKTMKIYVPLKDFYWNKDSGEVDFKNPEMKIFQDNLYKNSADDISMMF